MSMIASQITSVSIVYWIICSGAEQRKQQSSPSLAFVRGIHRWPVYSPHKWSVTRKMFSFDDIIMTHWSYIILPLIHWYDVTCSRPYSIKYDSILKQTLICNYFNYRKLHGVLCQFPLTHDDVIKWKHFPRYWPFVRGIHRSRWIPHTKASDAELWCLLWSESQ